MEKKDKNVTDENLQKEEYNKAEDGRIIDGPQDLDDISDMDKEAEKSIKDEDPLMDGDVEITDQEIEDLQNAADGVSSDESILSENFLDDEDMDGDELNVGPDENRLFHTGEDLDVSAEDLNPDLDPDSEDN